MALSLVCPMFSMLEFTLLEVCATLISKSNLINRLDVIDFKQSFRKDNL